jgi:hypothetical protein
MSRQDPLRILIYPARYGDCHLSRDGHNKTSEAWSTLKRAALRSDPRSPSTYESIAADGGSGERAEVR